MLEMATGRLLLCSLALGATGWTTPAKAMAATKLVLQVHEVKAVRETRGPLGLPTGADEVALAGVTISPDGKVVAVLPKWKVGQFGDDGDKRSFSTPHELAAFSLDQGSPYPKDYRVMLVLAELDQGDGIEKYVRACVDRAPRQRASAGHGAALETAALTALGGVAGGGVAGTVAGLVAQKVIEEAKRQLRLIWGDDIFPPGTAEVAISSPGFRFANGAATSPRRTARFVAFAADYRVTYSWRLR